MDVLVTYDVSTLTREGERRLTRIAAVCERYGVRVQYSVFECRLSPVAFEEFAGELMDQMKTTEDSINIYRFDRLIADSRTCLGRQPGQLGQPWIIRSAPPRRASDP